MTERLLDVSEAAARLSVRDAQLLIEPDSGDPVTTPIRELAAVVLSHPRTSITQAAVSQIAAAGGTVVFCGSDYLPAAMMLPVTAHSTQCERFARQWSAPLPLRKRLWQQVVSAKIRAQGKLLREWRGNDLGLLKMAERVRSGDPDNLEGQAARRYWPAVFADPHFRRGREGPDQNAHLNYGYAVLRAVTARAICAAGLHPSAGLQHHNRYNAFCLADDLMEPYRPLVDRAVAVWIQEHDPAQPLDKPAKAHLIAPFMRRYEVEGESRTFFDLMGRLTASLARALGGQTKSLDLFEV